MLRGQRTEEESAKEMRKAASEAKGPQGEHGARRQFN